MHISLLNTVYLGYKTLLGYRVLNVKQEQLKITGIK